MNICTEGRSCELFKVDLKIILPVEVSMNPPPELSEGSPGKLLPSDSPKLVVKSPAGIIGAYLLGVLMGVLIIL